MSSLGDLINSGVKKARSQDGSAPAAQPSPADKKREESGYDVNATNEAMKRRAEKLKKPE